MRSFVRHLWSCFYKESNQGIFRYAYNTHPVINPLTPNDPYSGPTAPLTSKRCILYIYSTNIGTEHFKHGVYSPFFFPSKCSLFHNSNLFGSCIIHILYTGCAKIKKNYGAKRLMWLFCWLSLATRNAILSEMKPHTESPLTKS